MSRAGETGPAGQDRGYESGCRNVASVIIARAAPAHNANAAALAGPRPPVCRFCGLGEVASRWHFALCCALTGWGSSCIRRGAMLSPHLAGLAPKKNPGRAAKACHPTAARTSWETKMRVNLKYGRELLEFELRD